MSSDPSSSNPKPAATEGDAYNAEALAAVNNKVLGGGGSSVEFPTVTLASGEKIRTGTVAGLLHNMHLYDASSDAAERAQLGAEMRLTIPLLRRLGLFDLFSPQEWMAEGGGDARRLVGGMALEAQEAEAKNE